MADADVAGPPSPSPPPPPPPPVQVGRVYTVRIGGQVLRRAAGEATALEAGEAGEALPLLPLIMDSERVWSDESVHLTDFASEDTAPTARNGAPAHLALVSSEGDYVGAASGGRAATLSSGNGAHTRFSVAASDVEEGVYYLTNPDAGTMCVSGGHVMFVKQPLIHEEWPQAFKVTLSLYKPSVTRTRALESAPRAAEFGAGTRASTRARSTMIGACLAAGVAAGAAFTLMRRGRWM